MATGDITFIRKIFSFQESDDDGTTPQQFPTPTLNITAADFNIISTTIHINNKTKEGLSQATALFILEEI